MKDTVLLVRVLVHVTPIAAGAACYVVWRHNRPRRGVTPRMSAAIASVFPDTSRPHRRPTRSLPDAMTSPAGTPAGDTHPLSRHRLDDVGLGSGVAVFSVTAAVATRGSTTWEETLFSAVNGLPNALMPVVWPFMQYGAFLTIPALGIIALRLRRVRLSIAIGVAGTGAYFLARRMKLLIRRGRPQAFVGGVIVRESFGGDTLGYPSGHAAVSGALTMVMTPYLPRGWKIIPAALLLTVAFARMYVAAHLPLDVVGGAAFGVVLGAVTNLVVGFPSQPNGLPGTELG